MSDLLDLSGKVDPLSSALMACLNETAESLGVAFFVAGAAARDIIFDLGHGRPSPRATLDLDFGVRVESWAEFAKFRESLLTTGHFQVMRALQELLFRGKLRVDIVPFGGIADSRGEIRWPPDEEFVMSTVGFEDAYRAAQRVRVKAEPPLDILVASIPGLTILKLISWADRPQARSRDAIDLAFILDNYLDAGNNDRLNEDHLDLVEVEDFDYVRAGARLLGRDVAKVGALETMKRIKGILGKEIADGGRQSRLIPAMMPPGSVFLNEDENRSNKLLALLFEFVKGLNDP